MSTAIVSQLELSRAKMDQDTRSRSGGSSSDSSRLISPEIFRSSVESEFFNRIDPKRTLDERVFSAASLAGRLGRSRCQPALRLYDTRADLVNRKPKLGRITGRQFQKPFGALSPILANS